MRTLIAGLFAAASFAGAALAQNGDELDFVDQATWVSAPTAEQAAAVFPARQTRSGDASLLCGIRRDGRLKKCEIQGERPQGAGFARAAMALSQLFKVEVTGVPPGQLDNMLISVPFHFPSPAERAAPRMLADPKWVQAPDEKQLQGVFPTKAAQAGATTGRAVVECTADPHGLMTNCQVIDEAPASLDFGLAALQVASGMAVNRWTSEGLPAEGARVKFAVRLNRDPSEIRKPQ